jgi:DNA-directed RNA polymerase specialized sigma24 family protein
MASMASALAPHLPYLRRYARALTGSQESGDAYVVATLEALVSDPASFPDEMPHKVGLFHVFLRIWDSIDINGAASSPASAGAAAADCNLEHITPRARKAFLLLALEEFTVREAAMILGTDEETVRALVDQASGEIAQQVATDVLIIEDEPLIAMDLEDLVLALEHRLIGIARTRKERLLTGQRPEPTFLITKPFQPSTVKAVMSQALFFNRKASTTKSR